MAEVSETENVATPYLKKIFKDNAFFITNFKNKKNTHIISTALN